MQATNSALGMSIEDAARVEHATQTIEALVERFKQQRKTSATAYRMPRNEYQPDATAPKDAALDPDWIKGASRAIFNYCVRKGYKTTVECIGWSAEPTILISW